MRFLSACIAVLVCLAVSATLARASVAECPAYIPAGVVIRILPDEKLTSGGAIEGASHVTLSFG